MASIPEVIIGNTIIIEATFTTLTGQLPTNDPLDIALRFYDQNEKQYGEDILIDGSHKKSMGVYQYPYLVPDDRLKLGREGNMSFKFTGILEDMVVSDGGKF